MGKFTKLAIYSLALIAIAACTSKFEDRDPDSQSSANGFTVADNMKANQDLDRKMQRLEDNAEKIRKLIKLVKRFGDSDRETYTQVDFLLDVNDQLAAAPSHADGQRYVRDGHITLKAKGLAPECQEIDTRLETMSQGGKVDTNVDNWGIPVDGLIYSVRTCHSEGQFVPVVSVTFTSYDAAVDFNNDNIRKTLTDVLAPVVQVNTNCQLTIDAQSVLSHATCTNLTSQLSATEKAVIESVVYDRSGDTRFDLEGKIWGEQNPKAQFSLKIDSNGHVWPKLEKIP